MIDQLTAEQLAAKLDAGEPFTLFDTRPADSYDAWHIHGAENVPFGPGDELSEDDLDRVRSRADGGPIVTICGKGLTSTGFGFALEQHGFEDVAVVKGGMQDWSEVYEVVPIETSSEDLVLVQLQRRAKGCLGYVVGSAETGEAAVVDATRQTDQFKIVAEEAGLTIEHVIDTHVHADHISGGRDLADSLGVPYHLGEKAADRDVAYEYEPLADGDALELGDVELKAFHTPGHTSDVMNYRVNDEALLTADTLFVESVGRTELQFGDADAATGAELLYDSLHDTILDLPDDTTVLPGHVSVSTDGRYEVAAPGDPIAARLGDLRSDLDLLGLDREAFVERLTDQTPEKPPNYERIIAINKGLEAPADESEATELELGPNNCAA
ncbi:rhodanese-like domain-containing protein [Halorientalis brevis]|uniref:Rhodanese-like domain-containing protein n=1 Tax=Halorientalis brevis TaxID=1126241 RepID=A0ABD6CBQ5_9EURY|nr:rhodanese-like domain-containing protein [Halorientalis brevis]